jgi:hypothetical protein
MSNEIGNLRQRLNVLERLLSDERDGYSRRQDLRQRAFNK